MAYADTQEAIALGCLERGIELQKIRDYTPGLLDHSRNVLLDKFERSDADLSLWLDADTSFKDAGLLFDLMGREEEIIARGYPMRGQVDEFWPPESLVNARMDGGMSGPTRRGWAVWPMLTNMGLHWSQDRKLIEAAAFGWGWVLMKHSAATKLLDFYGRTVRDCTGSTSIPAFSRRANLDGQLCFEDTSFADRWRLEMGEKLWCAPNGYITNSDTGGEFAEVLGLLGYV